MARLRRPSRASRPVVPEVPYYAVGERVVTETPLPTTVVRDDSNNWLWLLLVPLVLLLVVGAYLLGRDGDDDTVVNQTPAVQPSAVVTQVPAPPVVVNPPPVVVNPPPVVVNPPPVVVTQAPAPASDAQEPAAPAPS